MRDFSKATVKALASKGISIIGLQAIPVNGSFINSERGYKLNDNGTGRIVTFNQVLELAK